MQNQNQSGNYGNRQISESEIKLIAEAAAEMAIANLFEIFGVDVTTKEGRKGLQDDLTWVRGAREGTTTLRKAGWVAALGSLVSGVFYALWKGLTVLAAVGGKTQ